jgi:hypothetical protein
MKVNFGSLSLKLETSVANRPTGQIASRSIILRSHAVLFSHMLRLQNEELGR